MSLRNWKVSVWDTHNNLIALQQVPAESPGAAIDIIINKLDENGWDQDLIGSADAEEI